MKRYTVIISLLVLGVLDTHAQQILIDQGVQAQGLWCFPIHQKPNKYLYLPQRARFALKNDSLPEFSYMRYMTVRPSDNQFNTIAEAGGGGILTFLVLYDTPLELVTNAQEHLKRLFENDEIVLQGPVVFDAATFTLVSSVLQPETGDRKREIMASGEAPVLENSRIPLSFEVAPMRSKLLLESFKMATPDVSLVFELSFSGLTDSYEAELEVDWSEVAKSHAFDAGGSIYFVSADVGLGFDKLRKDNAIKLTSTGSDESMESLVQTVYSKLLELMFKPVTPAEVPEDQRRGLKDALGALISADGAMGSRNTTGFGLNVAYQYKEHRTTGKSHMTFKGRSLVHRNHFITFNVGNIYKEYGNNENVFHDVPLWDPAFQQRDVHVGIDGNIEKEFDKLLNSVTVSMRKRHLSNAQTDDEVLITKKSFKDADGKVVMHYLNQKDTIPEEWLNYEYRTTWKFIGGGSIESEWKREKGSMINLHTPYERRNILLTGDLNTLKDSGVRAVAVKIEYPFFGETKSKNLTIYPDREATEEPSFKITLPKGKDAVDYTITWFKKGQAPITSRGVDTYGLIFIDELPTQ